MLLNIVLAFALFAALGHIAYKIMHEYVSIPIRALIGCAGYGISQFLLDILNLLSIDFGWMLLASVACSCVLILILRKLRRLLYICKVHKAGARTWADVERELGVSRDDFDFSY